MGTAGMDVAYAGEHFAHTAPDGGGGAKIVEGGN